MYDNKIRLSPDVLEKAELIAQEWGLKNARAAVEAVFRKYADEYLERRSPDGIAFSSQSFSQPEVLSPPPQAPQAQAQKSPASEAMNALDDLLGL